MQWLLASEIMTICLKECLLLVLTVLRLHCLYILRKSVTDN